MSTTTSPPDHQHILAALHLEAILPTLTRLPEVSSKIKAQLPPHTWALKFQTPTGLNQTLCFQKNSISTLTSLKNTPPPFPLTLHFTSDRQLNNLFQNSGLAIPIPLGALWHLPKLKKFTDLTSEMEKILKTNQHPEKRARLLMGYTLMNAVASLANHDQDSKKTLSPFHGYTAQMEIPSLETSSWLTSSDHHFTAGSGRPPVPPDVILRFHDLPTASASIDNVLDELSAIGNCRLEVLGMIPFADTLNIILDKVARYLR